MLAHNADASGRLATALRSSYAAFHTQFLQPGQHSTLLCSGCWLCCGMSMLDITIIYTESYAKSLPGIWCKTCSGGRVKLNSLVIDIDLIHSYFCYGLSQSIFFFNAPWPGSLKSLWLISGDHLGKCPSWGMWAPRARWALDEEPKAAQEEPLEVCVCLLLMMTVTGRPQW